MYTAPSESPSSINNGSDVVRSGQVVFQNLGQGGSLGTYDAVLVACFSVHTLVALLADKQGSSGKLAVTGIFEASILASLSLLGPPPIDGARPKWGIVTTGRFWEKSLSDGVHAFLGVGPGSVLESFAGVESTGLDAGDFHGGVDPNIIRQRMKEATKRLLGQGDVRCVAMGCAGMAGLEGIIRSAAVEELGLERGNEMYIVDGITAGLRLLEQMVRNQRAFKAA